MAKHKYATFAYDAERMARAVGLGLPISVKHSVNVCTYIRSKPLARAKRELQMTADLKRPLPFGRYNWDLAHRAGMAAGSFPSKACKFIAQVLASAEANAVQKGLNPASLVVAHICAHKGARNMHGGRHRGRVAKNTHIEIVLAEVAQPKKEDKKESKAPKKESTEQKTEHAQTKGAKK